MRGGCTVGLPLPARKVQDIVVDFFKDQDVNGRGVGFERTVVPDLGTNQSASLGPIQGPLG